MLRDENIEKEKDNIEKEKLDTLKRVHSLAYDNSDSSDEFINNLLNYKEDKPQINKTSNNQLLSFIIKGILWGSIVSIIITLIIVGSIFSFGIAPAAIALLSTIGSTISVGLLPVATTGALIIGNIIAPLILAVGNMLFGALFGAITYFIKSSKNASVLKNNFDNHSSPVIKNSKMQSNTNIYKTLLSSSLKASDTSKIKNKSDIKNNIISNFSIIENSAAAESKRLKAKIKEEMEANKPLLKKIKQQLLIQLKEPLNEEEIDTILKFGMIGFESVMIERSDQQKINLDNDNIILNNSYKN